VLDTLHRWRHFSLRRGKGSHGQAGVLHQTSGRLSLSLLSNRFSHQLVANVDDHVLDVAKCNQKPQTKLSAVEVELRGFSRTGDVAYPGVTVAMTPSALHLSAAGSLKPLLTQRTLDRLLRGQREHLGSIEAKLLHFLQAQLEHVCNAVQLLPLGRDHPEIALPVHQCPARQPASAENC
jgi:hypothetical protein